MISHLYDTIFVHIPKTGGQSVELVFLEAHKLRWRSRNDLLLRHSTDRSRGPSRLAHLYAHEYSDHGYIDAADFRKYFKFAIVRDPYQRLMSEYRYRKSWQRMSIDQFLAVTFDNDWSDSARHLVPQVKYLKDAQGGMLVDEIVRFENLTAELAPVFRRIFGEDRELPHRNSSKSGSGTVADLTKAQMKVITEKYAADFEAFGYPTRD